MKWTGIVLFFGILIMAYGFYNCLLVYKIFSNQKCWFSFGGKIKKIWLILLILIVFFFIGYVAYFISLFNIVFIPLNELIISIFFFGAIFVLIMTKMNYEVYKKFIRS